jgi:predicted MFS family arabinose efflux permease
LAAAFISYVGDWLYRLALPLIVYRVTKSPALTAITYAIEYAPYIVLSPLAGVLADRADRRRLLVTGDIVSALVLGVLVLLLHGGVEQVGLVYTAALLLAMVSPFYHPAIQSLVPIVVNEADLTKATARLQTVESVVALAGPLLGGSVIVTLGTTNALLLDAASFAVSALVIAGMRARRTVAGGGRDGVGAELGEAGRYIRRDDVILSGAILFASANFAVFLVQANLIYYLSAVRGFRGSLIGVVFAAQGAGALLGSLIAPAFARRFSGGRVILGSTFAAGVITLFLLWARGLVPVSTVIALESAAGTVTAVAWFGLRLRRVPNELLGRVVALTRMVAFASIPAAAVAGGLLLDVTGSLSPLIVGAAAIQVVLGALGVLGPLNRTGETVAPGVAGIDVGASPLPAPTLPEAVLAADA